MREIKFRGQRVNNKKWVYGCYIYDEYQSWIVEYGENIRYEVIPKTVGQYTNLKHKSGQEIYQGDIINHKQDKIKEGWYIAGTYDYHPENAVVVKFVDGCYWVEGRYVCEMLIRYLRRRDDIETIGNIYNNPELLEAQDDS